MVCVSVQALNGCVDIVHQFLPIILLTNFEWLDRCWVELFEITLHPHDRTYKAIAESKQIECEGWNERERDEAECD